MVNERQNDWDIQLPHVDSAYNNSVSAATGLAPDEVHVGRLPHLPVTVFDFPNVDGHQRLNGDQLRYCDLARDRQQRAYDIVHHQHALTSTRIERRNLALAAGLRKTPTYAVGQWVWVYNTALPRFATISRKTRTTTCSQCRNLSQLDGVVQHSGVGPANADNSPDRLPIAATLLFLDLPGNMPGEDARRRVSVVLCKPRFNPHDLHDMRKYLPA